MVGGSGVLVGMGDAAAGAGWVGKEVALGAGMAVSMTVSWAVAQRARGTRPAAGPARRKNSEITGLTAQNEVSCLGAN